MRSSTATSSSPGVLEDDWRWVGADDAKACHRPKGDPLFNGNPGSSECAQRPLWLLRKKRRNNL